MIYATVSLKITNPASLGEYRKHAADALAKHGGAVVVAAPKPTVLEGAPNVPDALVLLSFPDRDGAMAWINDPDLADVHGYRRNAGTTEILLLG